MTADRLTKLEGDRKLLQLESYLDRFRVDIAEIPGIGPSRTAMLASYGIETARDIDSRKIEQIPGFGSVITATLLSWRKAHERNFRFDPSLPVERRFIENLDREIESKRKAHLGILRQGVADLMRTRQEILAARTRIMPILEKTWNEYKIAEAQRAV